MKRVFKSYSVTFQDIFKQNEEPKPIRELTAIVWAGSLQAAIDEAWKAVTLSPEDYEITAVVQENRCRTYVPAS